MSAVLVEAKEIEQESNAALQVAKDYKVRSHAEYLDSAAKLQAIKALSKKLDETFDPHIKRAFDAHRGLVAEKKQHQQPLVEAEGHIKRAVLGYQQEQERIRREAEAKAQEEARKEREKLEARAAAAAAKGKAERAAELTARAESVVTPLVAPSVPKVSGLSTRTTYKAEVVDKLALIKAVAEGRVPMNALDVNMPFLNNQAKVMKETLEYPGVKVVQDIGIASRSA